MSKNGQFFDAESGNLMVDPAFGFGGGLGGCEEFEVIDLRQNNRLRRFGSGPSAATSEIAEFFPVPEIEDVPAELSVVYTYDTDGNLATLASAPISSTEPGEFQGHYPWTGRHQEADISLFYNRSRCFDPSVGRWISGDPLGCDASDENFFKYPQRQQ